MVLHSVVLHKVRFFLEHKKNVVQGITVLWFFKIVQNPQKKCVEFLWDTLYVMNRSHLLWKIYGSIFLDSTSNLLHLGHTGCTFFGMYLWQRLYLITDMLYVCA